MSQSELPPLSTVHNVNAPPRQQTARRACRRPLLPACPPTRRPAAPAPDANRRPVRRSAWPLGGRNGHPHRTAPPPRMRHDPPHLRHAGRVDRWHTSVLWGTRGVGRQTSSRARGRRAVARLFCPRYLRTNFNFQCAINVRGLATLYWCPSRRSPRSEHLGSS